MTIPNNVTALSASFELAKANGGDTAAQIVFCKSSGGQAEGEMDGSMLR